MNKEDVLDGLTLDEIEELQMGPRGYQNEPGFEIVEDDPDYPGGFAPVPLVVVLCKSNRHPTPQPRFLSVFELIEKNRVEIRDKIAGGRIDVANQDRSRVVVGGLDDFAEVALQEGRGHAMKFGLKQLPKIIGFLVRIPDMVKALFK